MKSLISLTILSLLLTSISCNFDAPPTPPRRDKCWDFLHNLTNTKTPASHRSLEENVTLLYSGHNLNDLGQYHTCDKMTYTNYNLLNVAVGNIGFCGPLYCTTESVQAYMDSLINNISNMTHKDMRQYRVKVINPKLTGIETGFFFYVAAILVIGLITLTVLGTISTDARRKENNKQLSDLPTSVVEPSKESQESLREALLANKETVNEVFSKDTATHYIKEKEEKEEKEEKAVSRVVHHRNPNRNTTWLKLAECFDLRKNLHELLNFKVDPSHDPNLNVFNGVRAMAFGWVVIGHTMMSFLMSSKNYFYLGFLPKSWWALTLVGGTYAVDTFFYLSGFFTGFLLLSKLKKMPFGFGSYGKLVLHRVIRLWPAYLVCILIYWKLAVHYGDGVMWFGYVKSAQACSKDAWMNLFFVNNMFEGRGQCFNWGWYLACDFQMFLLAPFLCWIYLKNKSRGEATIWFLLVFSIISSYYESINNGNGMMFGNQKKADKDADNWGEDYINTLVRMSPYLLGFLLGIKFREYKSGKKNMYTEVKNNKVKSFLVFLAGLFVIFFCVYYPRKLQMKEDTWSNGFSTSWSVFTRPVYGLGVFLLTMPSLVGNLKSFLFFMSNSYFTIVSRLSYTAYLIHFVILLMIVGDTDQNRGFTEWVDAKVAFSICMLSCFSAALIHLFVEKPFVNIEMKFLNKRQPAAIKAKAEK